MQHQGKSLRQIHTILYEVEAGQRCLTWMVCYYVQSSWEWMLHQWSISHDFIFELTQEKIDHTASGGENWGQLILQPNHGEQQGRRLGFPLLCSASLFELCFVDAGRGRRKRRRSFELAKRLESTNSLCSTRPPTDWPNLNTCATLQLLCSTVQHT